jgi:hypothetical protein
MSNVTEDSYQGNPLLVIRNMPDDQWPFQIGVRKAKLILDHVDDIRAFVEKVERKAVAPSPKRRSQSGRT